MMIYRVKKCMQHLRHFQGIFTVVQKLSSMRHFPPKCDIREPTMPQSSSTDLHWTQKPFQSSSWLPSQSHSSKKKKNSSQKSIFCNAHQYFFETIKKAGGLASLSIWHHPFSKVLKKHLIYCIIHARGSINNFVVVAVCNYHAVVDSIVDVALHRWHKL